MADLKFSCPHCTQHISCGAEWGGMQIKCPACQSNITIPQAAPATPPPAPVRINVPASHAASPPPPPPPAPRSHAPPPPPAVHAPPPPPAAAPPVPRQGLAVARQAPPPPPQMEHAPQQQSLGGTGNPGVQWAGLVGAFLVTAVIIGMAATWKPPERKGNIAFVREKRGRKYVVVPKFKETTTEQAQATAADGDGDEKLDASSAPTVTNIAALVSKPGWTLDLQTARIPDAKASGQISGGAFTAERALLQRTASGYLLMLRQGAGPQIDRELLVSLPLKPGEKLDGNSWNVAQSATGSGPRIIKRWMQDARQQTKIFTNGYAMKLEFAQTQTNELPGKLFIALPDDEKSYVAGTLRASFLATPTVAPTPQQPRPQQPMTQRPPQQQQTQRPRPPY